MIIEKRHSRRAYIEKISDEDRKHKINSMGRLAQDNAYGEIVYVGTDGIESPVICGHGGSMWLCRKCKNEILLIKGVE